MTPTVLVIQHQQLCPTGWVGEWLAAEGLRLDVRHPYAGDPLPDDLRAHDGLVVLGGQMGANDDDLHAWLAPTKALIRSGAEQGVPVLGICLGHQLAAVALGGEVVVNPTGARRGVLATSWTDGSADDPVLGSCGDTAVFWHHDVVTRLPEGTRVLARAETGELLAARYAPTVWGVQCHPEARDRHRHRVGGQGPGPGHVRGRRRPTWTRRSRPCWTRATTWPGRGVRWPPGSPSRSGPTPQSTPTEDRRREAGGVAASRS